MLEDPGAELSNTVNLPREHPEVVQGLDRLLDGTVHRAPTPVITGPRPSSYEGCAPLAKGQRLRVVRARSWDELPEVLEPGVYIVNGRRHTVLEPIEKELLLKIIRRVSKLKGKFI